MIIGPYVLSGWGPREVAAEQLRRQSILDMMVEELQQQAGRDQGPMFAGLTVVLGFILVLGATSPDVHNDAILTRRRVKSTLQWG